MLYLLDADVLMHAANDYYAIDRVPEFWGWLLHMAASGKVAVPEEMYHEIIDGNDPLADWIKQHRNSVLLREGANPALVSRVKAAYASDLSDEETPKLGKDPFLIAYALADPTNRTVVSDEESAPSRQRANRKIPDVCDDLRLLHIKGFQLYHQLDFRTNWRATL